MINSKVSVKELTKVTNQAISSISFGEVQVLNRAMNLAYSALLGDANLVNTERQQLEDVTAEEILVQAQDILIENNSSTLYYHSNEN